MYFGFTLAVLGGGGGPSQLHSRSPRGKPGTFLQWPCGTSAVLQAVPACVHPTSGLAAHLCALALIVNRQTMISKGNHHSIEAFSFLAKLFELDIEDSLLTSKLFATDSSDRGWESVTTWGHKAQQARLPELAWLLKSSKLERLN